ncbi:hypothetical protein F5Y04DRAFT_285168 [Hypomontagnella monticulosa]|nr:hypothetical protein F5Y04DRAFT_285168 [Hypomontagnella monticulosa]
MEKRTTGRSAPYGQACLACFKTKCKCVPRPDGEGCERCHRLKRTCHPADALRRRNDKKQNPSDADARIAQLEGTLGQLVSMLQAGNVHVSNNITSPQPQEQQQPTPDFDHDPQSTSIPTLPTLPYEDFIVGSTDGSGHIANGAALAFDDRDDDGVNNGAVGTPWWVNNSGNQLSANTVPLASPPASTISGTTIMSEVSISQSTASACLDNFRSQKLHYLPFVHLPANLTSQQLQRDQPFLFRAIVCVTSSSTDDRRTRALELKRMLCETAFLQQPPQQPQQTLDLLLGVLTYISWGWDHILSRRSLSRLMAVAMSLAGEVCLDKVIPEPSRTTSLHRPKSFDGSYGSAATTFETTDTQFHLECQRAVLGCFVLGSTVSAYFSQIDAPRWTPGMEKALAAISNSNSSAQCTSDVALAFQVRLQLLATKAAQVRERCQLPDQPPVLALPAPALLYIKTLMGQIQDLRASIPPAFQQHFALLAQTYYTELCIIGSVHIQENPSSALEPSAPSHVCGPTRLSCLWQSALAIKSCMSTFLTLSPSDLLGVSFIQWAQFARCIGTLHKLTELSEPGWDLDAVRALVDLPALLLRMAEKLEVASNEVGEQAPDGVFNQLARGLRMIQSNYNNGNGGMPPVEGEEGQAGAGVDVDAMSNGQEGLFLNPTLWWDQFFGAHDEQMIPTL